MEECTLETLTANTITAAPRRVLYLTPVENDVWESILSSVEDIDGTPRLSVPNTPDRLIERWRRPGLSCTKREYATALERFIDAGFIAPIHTHTNRADGYRLTVNPDEYFVRVIRRRIPLFLLEHVISKALEHLKRYDDPSTPLPSYDELRALLEYEQPRPAEPSDHDFIALSHAHLIWMYVGGIPHTDPKDVCASKARGLFLQVNEDDRYIPSHPAFLPFRYFDVERRPVAVAHVYLVPEADGSSKPVLIMPDQEWRIEVSDGSFNDAGELSDGFFDPSDIGELNDVQLVSRMELCSAVSQLISSGAPLLETVSEARAAERRRLEEERVARQQRLARAQELRRQIEAMQQELSILNSDP